MNDAPPSKDDLTGKKSPEERARVVVALDHDARQPQNAIEMGPRNLRLLVGEMEDSKAASGTQIDMLSRMRAELASVQLQRARSSTHNRT